MSALANCLSYSDSSVQHAAAGALAVLGCDNTARVKVSFYSYFVTQHCLCYHCNLLVSR